MGFKATTHEPCLYYKHDDNGLTLILRQVDDFHVSAKTVAMCNKVGDEIRKRMTHPLNELGIIRKFNGVHADQTRDYTHLHCTAYIEHIVEHHGWTHEFVKNKPVPMKSYPKYQNDIQLTEGPTDPYQAKQLQQQMGFNYRQAIGELIYALTICRVDISPALITLSQHSAALAKIHYDAVKQVFLYLYATKHHGLTYWRTKP